MSDSDEGQLIRSLVERHMSERDVEGGDNDIPADDHEGLAKPKAKKTQSEPAKRKATGTQAEH